MVGSTVKSFLKHALNRRVDHSLGTQQPHSGRFSAGGHPSEYCVSAPSQPTISVVAVKPPLDTPSFEVISELRFAAPMAKTFTFAARVAKIHQEKHVADSVFKASAPVWCGWDTSRFRAMVGGGLAALFVSAAFAQTSTLEFDSTGGGPAGTGPSTADQVVTFRNNQNNPTDNLFNTTVNPVTATVSLTNIQAGLIVAFGQGFNATTGATNLALYGGVNLIGAPQNANFSSLAAATGLDINANGAVQIGVSTTGLTGGSAALTSTRNRMADITVTFSQPVTNPVLHFGGLGGSFTPGGGGTLGFTTEFDLLTAGVTMTRLSGNAVFAVSATQINNTATTPNSSCTVANQAACGSVQINGTNITTVSFRVFLRGDGGGATAVTVWGPAAPGQAGDVWTLSWGGLIVFAWHL